MSTGTNIDDLVGTEFNLYVEYKVILARVIESRHPELQISEEYWERASGAELWGLLRRYPIDRVLVSFAEPIRFVIMMADGEESTAYIKITYSEYAAFLDYFCNNPVEWGDYIPDRKVDWIKQGF